MTKKVRKPLTYRSEESKGRIKETPNKIAKITKETSNTTEDVAPRPGRIPSTVSTTSGVSWYGGGGKG